MIWIAVALAGGAEKWDAKLSAALEACGDDEACRASAVETAIEKAEKKGWLLPAVEDEEQRLAAAQRTAEIERGRAALQEAKALLSQEPVDIAAALNALVVWKREHPEHPDGGLLPRLMQEIFDRGTFAVEAPWEATVVSPVVVEGKSVQLKKRSEAKNQITDDRSWFSSNQLVVPAWMPDGRLPGAPPLALNLGSLGEPTFVTVDGDAPVAVYRDALRAVILDERGLPVRIFAMGGLRRAPRAVVGDEDFVEQELRWATVKDGVLYVASGHRTYAKSSYGQNAYVTAFDVSTGELRWRSPPLVANAVNFVVLPTQILCGYGFTAEPDFLFLLDRSTGAVQSKLPVRSGPDFLIVKGEELHVRTYDRDLVYAIQ